jgi:hypothetical protein
MDITKIISYLLLSLEQASAKDILLLMVSFILSVCLVYFIERRKAPRLFVKEENEKINTTAGQFKLYSQRLVIENRKKILLGFLGEPAWHCRAIANVYRWGERRAIIRGIKLRWAGTSQPIPIRGHIEIGEAEGSVLLFDEEKYQDKLVDIFPNETEILDVVTKIDDDKDLYLWTNKNYKHNDFRDGRLKIPVGRYLVEIIIYYSKGKCRNRFFLKNDNGCFYMRKICICEYLSLLLRKVDRQPRK